VLCRDLVHALRRYGIYVAEICDGDDSDDGDLVVAENVHVQVPTYGDAPRVVADPFHGHLRCFPPRATISELAADIRCALDDVPSALANSSLH
jgi:hypothetical protein